LYNNYRIEILFIYGGILKDKGIKKYISNLPKPLNKDIFSLFQKGIFRKRNISVYINQRNDFIFLYPFKDFNYKKYTPRVSILNLRKYKEKLKVFENRFARISKFFPNKGNIIEIGGGNGKFLQICKQSLPNIKFHILEPDNETKKERTKIKWLVEHNNIDELIKNSIKFDIVMLFHTFEHIKNLDDFLFKLKKITKKNGKIIIEIPVLNDPLLGLYNIKKFKEFYFSLQHPYVYSNDSFKKVIKYNKLKIKKFIPYQRYGIENHLNWLIKNKPGGNPKFKKIFSLLEQQYKNELEKSLNNDTAIIIAGI
tara:strand:- start:19981 stop:20910 length:930 start_codon:yes stop_codon:yes gene_type:complete